MKFYFMGDNYRKREFYESIFKLVNPNINFEAVSEKEIDKYSDKVKFKLSYEEPNELEKTSNIPVINVKEELYIEGLPLEKQPGENYRKVCYKNANGDYQEKIMNDRETVQYYSNLVKSMGGKVKVKLIDKINVKYKGKIIQNINFENNTMFTSKISKIIPRGNPFHSMILIPEFGDIYWSECDTEERRFLCELRSKKMLTSITNLIKYIEAENEKNID